MESALRSHCSAFIIDSVNPASSLSSFVPPVKLTTGVTRTAPRLRSNFRPASVSVVLAETAVPAAPAKRAVPITTRSSAREMRAARASITDGSP